MVPIVGSALGSVASGSVEYKYDWNPKVGEVVSGASGSFLFWELTHKPDEFLDGGHTYFATIRRPRNVTSMWLVINAGTSNWKGTWAMFAPGFWPDKKGFLVAEKKIPIEFHPSPIPT